MLGLERSAPRRMQRPGPVAELDWRRQELRRGEAYPPGRRVTHAEMRAALASAPEGTHVRAVLAAVLLHLGVDGEPCTARVDTLAAIAGADERSVQRTLRTLEASVLQRIDRPGKTIAYSWRGVAHDTPDVRVTPDADDTPGVAPATPPSSTTPRSLTTPEVKNPRSTTSEVPTVTAPIEPEQRRAPARPRASRTPPNAELFAALVQAAGWDIAKLTPSQRARTGKAAKGLATVAATPDDVAVQAMAMEAAWGDPPAPWTIEANWNRPLNGRPRRRATATNWTPKGST